MPGTNSQKATDALQKSFPAQANGVSPVVLHAKSGKLTDSKYANAVNEAAADVAKAPYVASVVNPLTSQGASQLSKDQSTAYLAVGLSVSPGSVSVVDAHTIIDAAAKPAQTAGLEVETGGSGRSEGLEAFDRPHPVLHGRDRAGRRQLLARTNACARRPHTKRRSSAPTASGSPVPLSHTCLEYYDYATPEGRAETRSHPHDPRATALVRKLFNQYVRQQPEAPLPFPLKRTVARARASYIRFEAQFNVLNLVKLIQDGQLGTLLGYGSGPF